MEETTMDWTKRSAPILAMVIMALSMASTAEAQTQGNVVVITPPGYGVTHQATTTDQLAAPPPTQLQQPGTLAVPVTTHPGAMADEPRTRANRGLVVAGVVSLGVGYVGNLVGSLLYSSLRAVSGVANTDEFLAFSLVPVVGPWLQLPFASSGLEVGFLIGAGVLQAAGVTMLIAGLTFARRPVTEVRISDSSSVVFTPMVGSDSAGLSAVGTF